MKKIFAIAFLSFDYDIYNIAIYKTILVAKNLY